MRNRDSFCASLLFSYSINIVNSYPFVSLWNTTDFKFLGSISNLSSDVSRRTATVMADLINQPSTTQSTRNRITHRRL